MFYICSGLRGGLGSLFRLPSYAGPEATLNSWRGLLVRLPELWELQAVLSS